MLILFFDVGCFLTLLGCKMYAPRAHLRKGTLRPHNNIDHFPHVTIRTWSNRLQQLGGVGEMA